MKPRQAKWKRWLAYASGAAAIAIPVVGFWQSNQIQINAAKAQAEKQHAAAESDRAVVHQRLSTIEAVQRWHDQQLEDILKECRR